jgi:hypothetical protein
MPRPLKWAGWLRLFPALLLLPLASFAIGPPDKENPRIAAEPSDVRIDSPRLFARVLVGTELEPKSPPGAFAGFPSQAQATFTEHARNKAAGMPLPAQPGRQGPRGACEHSASDLCFDLADGRIVYRPARQYMPKLDGLTAENVTLRRNGIRFRYSFR